MTGLFPAAYLADVRVAIRGDGDDAVMPAPALGSTVTPRHVRAGPLQPGNLINVRHDAS